ncbi:MAG: hypothetical protein ABEJ65_11445, partial [bacterium]
MKDNLPEALQQAFNSDRLAHAYLFYGRPTTMYETTVLDFFKGLTCTRRDDLEYCGSCPDCTQIDQYSYPDLTVVPDPEQQNTTSVGVDTVRNDVIETASLTASRGTHKLFWLDDIDRFTSEASNTLLKVLEEPPGSTVFILTARSLWDCMDTIRSRCQWIRFPYRQSLSSNLLEECRQFWPEQSYGDQDIEQWVKVL